MTLSDLQILVVCVEGAMTGSKMLEQFVNLRQAHPEAVGYRAILDLRRWRGGTITDDEIADYFATVGTTRQVDPVGTAKQVTLVYVALDAAAAVPLQQQIEAVSRGRYVTAIATTAAEAWNLLEPGRPIPESVRALLH